MKIKTGQKTECGQSGYSGGHLLVIDKLLITGIVLLVLLKIYLLPLTGINNYPFIASIDTWEFLNQGLSYLGYPTNNVNRPPLFPLIFAVFYKFSVESYAGVIPTAFFMLLLASVYQIAKTMFDRTAGLLAVIMMLLHPIIFIHSYYLNADYMCAALTTLALALALHPDKKMLIWAWVVLSASFFAQYLVSAPVVFIVCLLIYKNRNDLTSRENITGCVLYSAIIAGYIIIQKMKGGLYGETGVMFAGIDQVVRYISDLASYLGAVCLGLIVSFGVYAYMKKADIQMRKNVVFLSSWFIITFHLFALFLAFGSNLRYLIYISIPLIVMMSVGLKQILSVVRPSVLKYVVLTIFLVVFNTNHSTSFWPNIREVTLLPGLVYNYDDGFKRNPFQIFYKFFIDNRDCEKINFMLNKNFLQEEVLIVAPVIAQQVSEGEYFSIIPLDGYSVRITGKLEHFSKRRHVEINKNNEDDNTRAMLVRTSRSIHTDDINKRLDQFLTDKGYSIIFQTENLTLYKKTQTSHYREKK